MIEILAQIECDQPGKKFTAGIVLWDDVVVEAAPIVGYMRRQKWTRDRVRAKCKDWGWKVSVIHQVERNDTKYIPGSPSGKARAS